MEVPSSRDKSGGPSGGLGMDLQPPAFMEQVSELAILQNIAESSKKFNSSLEKKRSLLESAEKIEKLVKTGKNIQGNEQNRRQIVVLGVTGSGKSTLVNSLAGCRIVRMSTEEADRLADGNRDAVRVEPLLPQLLTSGPEWSQ